MKLLLLNLLLVMLMSSCSSLTSVSEYKTYNEAQDEFLKSKRGTKFISDYDKIPKFNKLKYKMAPGHLFYLNHPSDSKLKGRYRADFEGILRLPYNVVIKVNGLSFREVKAKVLEAYSKFFQRGVENVEFKLIYKNFYVEVRGFVKKSGRYLVSQNESIDKVIDKAGGLNGDLNKSFYKASIKQQDKSYAINLNQYFQNNFYSNSFTWTGGDTIFVSEQDESEMGSAIPIVTVLGGVNNPGKVLYKDQANIFYYLSKTGGVIPNLAYDRAMIMRNTEGGLKKIKFDLTNVEDIPHIYPQDTIVLQSDSRNKSDRFFDRAIQILSIITTILLINSI